jgi:membrane-associated phospholipid phosphatase
VTSTAPAPRPRPGVRPTARPRTAGAVALCLAVALASAAGVWLTWRVFVTRYTGQRVDQVVFEGAELGQGRLWQVAEPVLDVVSVPYVALVLLAAVLIATARRRWELAVQVAVLMGGANLSTQVLKHWVLDRPDLGITPGAPNALPSGHTTAAASVSAALVFVVPPRARPWAAVLGAAYTSATGVSTLIGRWHRPSDVVAAVLVVLAWSALACALTATSRTSWRSGRPGGSGGRAAGGGTGADPTGPGSIEPDLSATAALTLAGAPGRTTGRVVSGMLVLAGLAAAVPAGLALRQIWFAPDAPATRTELLTGYAGGALGVVAASCVAFAVLLAIRDLAGRAGPRTA